MKWFARKRPTEMGNPAAPLSTLPPCLGGVNQQAVRPVKAVLRRCPWPCTLALGRHGQGPDSAKTRSRATKGASSCGRCASFSSSVGSTSFGSVSKTDSTRCELHPILSPLSVKALPFGTFFEETARSTWEAPKRGANKVPPGSHCPGRAPTNQPRRRSSPQSEQVTRPKVNDNIVRPPLPGVP